jgi:hypothetical protein
MRFVSTLAVATLTAWLMTAGSARAELVVNGGFESGDFTSWTTQGVLSNLFQVSNVISHTGSYSVVLADLEVDDDEFYQTVPTTLGQQYTLDFWVYNYGVGDDGMHVEWEGNTALNVNPLDAPLESWFQYTLPLTATANGSELRFGGFDIPLGFYIDDISLTAVPEPSSLGLAALGLAGLGLVARRKKVRRVSTSAVLET